MHHRICSGSLATHHVHSMHHRILFRLTGHTSCSLHAPPYLFQVNDSLYSLRVVLRRLHAVEETLKTQKNSAAFTELRSFANQIPFGGSRTAICWTSKEKMGRGLPRTTWGRTAEADLRGLGHSWGTKLQALVYDILPLEEGAGKRCSECAGAPDRVTGRTKPEISETRMTASVLKPFFTV